uniref:Uncharacterized protein n=1 Tax=Avena sativa TaxID=4498 RepID=A0ACD5YZY3_AVESA
MNPRDCYYWLNGNCLNPKCSFRHPPIDGMFGAPTPGMPAVSSNYAAYNSGKQMVPCYYFQKGNCIKGDKCPFYHPQSAGNNPPEQVVKASSFPSEQPQTQKNDFLGIKEFGQTNHSTQQGGLILDDRSKMTVNRPTANSAKTATAAMPAELASNGFKSVLKSERVQNSMPAANKSFRTSSEEELLDQNNLIVENDLTKEWNQSYQAPADDLPQNSRDADELTGESPGFDVLVDNDADGAYLRDDEDFGRDIYPIEDYEYAPADFEMLPHHERELFNGMSEQVPIRQKYDGYERKRRRPSSERNMDRPSHSERRSRHRETGPVEIDGSDLRHRLRRRKINGSAVISPERSGEQRRRDEHYRERERAYDGHHTHRDRHQGSRGSTLSSRLQGRIKLPGRSPDRVDTRSETERDRRQLRDRLSPVRHHMDIQGGRHREAPHHQERTRRRSSERASSGRNADGQHLRRNVTDTPNFATRRDFGPESRKANGSVESEASLDFEGPKPLSLILERKRQAAVSNGLTAHSVKEDKSVEVSRRQPESRDEAAKAGYDSIASSEEYKSRSGDEEYKEECQMELVDGHGQSSSHGDKPEEYKEECQMDPVDGHGQSSSHGDKPEVEDIIEVDPAGNQEAGNYEQREGESDYEATEGPEYKFEDESVYQDDDEEYEDDDDDDFARKVGVVFS